jgi:hypothetical protein
MERKSNKKYKKTRASVIIRGETLHSFALKNRIPIGSIYNALNGARNGIKAVKIRKKVEEFLNEP